MLSNILDTKLKYNREPDRVLSGRKRGNGVSTANPRVPFRTDIVKEEPDTKRCKPEEGMSKDRLIPDLWSGIEERASRVIMIPVNSDSEYNEIGFLLGPGGSRLRALEAEAGGRVQIRLCGKGTHGNGPRFDNKNESPHVILEGDNAWVDKVALLINNILQIPKISRKIMILIRPGHDYGSILIGPGGSKIRTVEAEAGGLVSILVRDGKRTGDTKQYDIKDEQPHVLLYGESSCVNRAEIIICDIIPIKITRKIMIPAHTGYNYAALLVGHGGSRVKALETEAGGRVSILVRDGKRMGITKNYDTKGEAPHVLLEGEASCVLKAKRMIDDLWNFQVVSRKLVIPSGWDYARLLIGQGGGIIKTLKVEAGGRVEIHVRDGKGANGWHDISEPPYLQLEGEASCVSKAKSMIMDLFQNTDRERTEHRNYTDFNKSIVATSNNNGRSALDRVNALKNDIGLKISSDDSLCNKVMRLEHEVFGKAKSGTIMKRVSDLEKELG